LVVVVDYHGLDHVPDLVVDDQPGDYFFFVKIVEKEAFSQLCTSCDFFSIMLRNGDS
jgi:hypothetical protein